MYQNAPPQYQGGYQQQQQQQQYGGGGGYYDNTNGMAPQNQYGGAPSPVNAAYQRANAAMTHGTSPSPVNGMAGPMNAGGGGAGGGTGTSNAASGLIRLTLRKPMGIVFEPMTDPHNPSQQRGVRICDLPRTGAAAMSMKLEVGDELLSINDKTMSRLTFDEIMDFIIEADKERVDLLFRRPVNRDDDNKKASPQAGGGQGKNPGGVPSSPMALGAIGSNSNSVKWIDEKGDMGGNNKLAKANIENERSSRRDSDNDPGSSRDRGSSSGKGRKSKVRDEPSIDEATYDDATYDDATYDDATYDDGGYTVESQSQYTRETYDDDRGGRRRGGKRVSRKDRRRSKGRSGDPVESGGFLDLLIDTLCTSVMGRDARDMCVSDSGRKERYDDDDEFTVDDGGTYATYEEDDRRDRRKRMDEDESYVTNDDTYDDGTRTLESNIDKKYQKQDSHDKSNGDLHKKALSSPKFKPREEPIDQNDGLQFHGDVGGHHDPQLHHMPSAPDPPTKMASRDNIRMASSAPISNQIQQQHNIVVDHAMNEQESAIASGIALPLKELEINDNYAADVSVMESLGGPSLLVERARHENAAHTGADRAAYESLERQDPELAELVATHGEGFAPDPGMSKDETAFRDPYKFYEYAVCQLLRENEPEKVRLLSKLMAKYRGRERHLINKLSARYNKDGNDEDAGDDNEAAAAPGVAKSKSNASEASNNLANKRSVSGMDKIQEVDDGEEAGSSVLNDPSRANMAAIEAVKKKMESAETAGAQDKGIPSKKSSNDDGWPPAMSDPWGTAGGQQNAPSGPTGRSNSGDEDAPNPRPIDHDDEGSYSDGSSYTESGDEVDGTSPAIIAQVSELLNYVYGKTSVAGQIDRVSTIMRAYEGREAVLLELLETKALIKANADSNAADAADIPMSLRNNPSINNAAAKAGNENDGNIVNNVPTSTRSKGLPAQTPVSALTASTMDQQGGNIGPRSLATIDSQKEGATSPSASTLNSTASKKKKKGMLGKFFGSKKSKDKKGGSVATKSVATKSSKRSKKGQRLDDGEI